MMHWIDIAIIVVLGLTILVGLWRGFIHEILSIIAWIAAFLAARIFSPDFAQWLAAYVETQAVIMLLAWLIPFLLAFITVNLVRVVLKSMVNMVGLKPVDRLFGAVFGAAKGVLLITAIVLVAQLAVSKSGSAFKSESKMLPYFQEAALWFLETLDQQSNLKMPDLFSNIDKLDKLASEAAMSLGLDRDELLQLQSKLNISSTELSAMLEDPKQLEAIRKLIQESDFLKAANKN